MHSLALLLGVKLGGRAFLRLTGADAAGLGPRMDAAGDATRPSLSVSDAVIGPCIVPVPTLADAGGSSMC